MLSAASAGKVRYGTRIDAIGRRCNDGDGTQLFN